MKRWDERPSGQEIADAIAYLRAKGVKANVANDVTRGETRRDMASRLREYLRMLPKAS